MKCFEFLKKKPKSASEPQLNPNRSRNTGLLNRVVNSSSSLPSPRSVIELYKLKEHTLRRFTFQELKEATNGFNRLLKIGEGCSGSVYKGSIRPESGQGDSVVVAIKKLNSNGWQGQKQWLAEVQFLGIVDHPNLVKLLGYCSADVERGIQRLLVYEFMPNKSLEDHLFRNALPPLPWKTRLEIMLGAAEGLDYLHGGLEVQVIYRDFKSSNVLLDEEFNPKLSDFGLAREGPTDNQTHVSTGTFGYAAPEYCGTFGYAAPEYCGTFRYAVPRYIGTSGYAAPEYVETGCLTLKSDMWSFGAVLYEILTGRRTLDRNRPTVEQKLVEWVKLYPADSKRFRLIIDPRLRKEYSLSSARRVAKLADSCLNKNAKDRPTMSQIIESLKEAISESESGTGSKNPTSIKKYIFPNKWLRVAVTT